MADLSIGGRFRALNSQGAFTQIILRIYNCSLGWHFGWEKIDSIFDGIQQDSFAIRLFNFEKKAQIKLLIINQNIINLIYISQYYKWKCY